VASDSNPDLSGLARTLAGVKSGTEVWRRHCVAEK
jgi:hypothetical protein